MLLAEPKEAAAMSSESSGVGRGGGNWMLVRSGRDPPLLWAAGFRDVVICCSGVGNMLQETDRCCESKNAGLEITNTHQYMQISQCNFISKNNLDRTRLLAPGLSGC